MSMVGATAAAAAAAAARSTNKDGERVRTTINVGNIGDGMDGRTDGWRCCRNRVFVKRFTRKRPGQLSEKRSRWREKKGGAIHSPGGGGFGPQYLYYFIINMILLITMTNRDMF